MDINALKNQLQEAKRELESLQAELPQFHALVTEAEAEAARLRTEKAPLDAQAQVRGRLSVARELLEQHQADIATAQSKVNSLQAQLERDERLQEMAQHARTASAHRSALEQAVARAVEGLEHAAQIIIREWAEYERAKGDFITAGAKELGAMNWPGSPAAQGLRGEEGQRFQERVLALLKTLRERGVDLSGLLEGDAVDFPYRADRPLPSEGLAMLVWSAVLAHEDVPHNLKRSAPRPKSPVYLTAAPAGGGKYRI